MATQFKGCYYFIKINEKNLSRLFLMFVFCLFVFCKLPFRNANCTYVTSGLSLCLNAVMKKSHNVVFTGMVSVAAVVWHFQGK